MSREPDDPRDPKQDPPSTEPSLGRRRFVELTAVGVPALLSSCADDGAAGGDGSGSASSTGELGTTAGDGVSLPGGTAADETGTGGTEGDEQGSEETGSDPVDFDPEAIPESTDLFPRTVMAGDMDPTSMTVAMYIADAAPKRLRVWQPTGDDGMVDLLFDEDVTPDADGFVKERIAGLSPGQWYQYAYFNEVEGQFVTRSLIGNVHLPPEAGTATPVTIAFGSCVGRGTLIPDFVNPNDVQPFFWDITDMAEALDYDVFVHLGDQGYMDQVYSAGGTYESYLEAWGAYHGGGFRQIYPKTGMLCTWDDHEVTDNGTVDPWTTDPSERERIDNAMAAYYRVMPIVAEDHTTEPLWRSMQWGDTVELVVLDTRYERQPEPGLAFMSVEQMEFLLDRIENSPCRFVCVATGKPYSHVRLVTGDYPGGEERWQEHIEDRQQVRDLVNAIDSRRVIWVTGDIHMCYLGNTDEDDDSAAGQMWEVCCTSGNTNPLALLLSTQQFEWFSDRPHMPVLTFDAELGEILVRFYDSDGNIAHERTIFVPA